MQVTLPGSVAPGRECLVFSQSGTNQDTGTGIPLIFVSYIYFEVISYEHSDCLPQLWGEKQDS